MSLAAHITTTVGTVTIDAELTCHAGETVALLGPNGAGKSTLLAAIAGLRAIDNGYIHIDSTSVDEPARAIFLPPEHRRVGVLFQDYLLFPHMTVRQNIAFGPKNLGIASEGEWIAALGLTDLLDHKPNELSGGKHNGSPSREPSPPAHAFSFSTNPGRTRRVHKARGAC